DLNHSKSMSLQGFGSRTGGTSLPLVALGQRLIRDGAVCCVVHKCCLEKFYYEGISEETSNGKKACHRQETTNAF
ncbi:hypothetical protein GCK32_015770, partial [Trichostrongylus colubriformis]